MSKINVYVHRNLCTVLSFEQERGIRFRGLFPGDVIDATRLGGPQGMLAVVNRCETLDTGPYVSVSYTVYTEEELFGSKLEKSKMEKHGEIKQGATPPEDDTKQAADAAHLEEHLTKRTSETAADRIAANEAAADV